MSLSHYIQTTPWLKPLRNAGWLLLGRGGQLLCSIGYIALATRALGVEQFGILALMHSFVLAVAAIAQFSSWQMLMRYGAVALQENNKPHFQQLVWFAGFLDILGSLIGIAIIVFFIEFSAETLNIPEKYYDILQIYAISVISITLSTSSLGILRLLDKFRLLALHATIEPLIRLIGAGILFFFSSDLIYFLVTWFIALVVSRMAMVGLAIYHLKKSEILDRATASLDLCPEKGIWRFIFGVNIGTTLKLSASHLPVLLVGSLLGPAAAGLFRVAQQLADILIKPGRKLLVPAIFPELSRLSAAKEHSQRREMVMRLSLLIGGLAILVFTVFVLYGDIILLLIAGEEFRMAYGVMVWLAAAGVITLLSFPLEPLMLSAGMAYRTVLIHISATAGYVISFYQFAPYFELKSAGMAAVVYTVMLGLISLAFSWKLIKEKNTA